ncbi:DUF1499 domain-containing protein [Haliangium sp.]|uniref:DUF1499 domain-containing protein n=1 Tax=Haliangium sp. TaxID=2663208 RepID=UPI003D0E23FF
MHRLVSIMGLASLISGPLLSYLNAVPPLVGFGIYALGGVFGLVALIWGLIATVRKSGRQPLVSALVGLGCVAAVAVPAVAGRDYPRINDISTDLEDPPALTAAPEYPAEFVPIVRAGYPELSALVLDAPPSVVFDLARDLAQAQPGWTVDRADDNAMVIEGVAMTRVFRFRDDFVIRVRPHDGKSMVDMRSRSRDGKGDLGANARRIQGFFDALAKRTAAHQ